MKSWYPSIRNLFKKFPDVPRLCTSFDEADHIEDLRFLETCGVRPSAMFSNPLNPFKSMLKETRKRNRNRIFSSNSYITIVRGAQETETVNPTV